jgi:hypothetical protein
MAFGERNADSADASHSWKPFIPAPAMFRDFRHTMSTAQITTYLTTHYCPTLRFSDEFRHTTDFGDFIHVEMSRCGCSALSPLRRITTCLSSRALYLHNPPIPGDTNGTSRPPVDSQHPDHQRAFRAPHISLQLSPVRQLYLPTQPTPIRYHRITAISTDRTATLIRRNPS